MNRLDIRNSLQTVDPAAELEAFDAERMLSAAIERGSLTTPPSPPRRRRWPLLPVAVAATVLAALAVVLLAGGASQGPLSAKAMAAKLRATLAPDAILHVKWRDVDGEGATLTTGERWEYGERSRMVTRRRGNEFETARSGMLQRWRSTDHPKLQTERMSTYEPVGTSSGWQEQLRSLARDPAGWQLRELSYGGIAAVELSKPFDRDGGRDVVVLRRDDARPLEIRIEVPQRPRFAVTHRFELVERLDPSAENVRLLDIPGAPLPAPDPAPATAPAQAPRPPRAAGPLRIAPPSAGDVEHVVERFDIAQAELRRDPDTPARTRTETWRSRDSYRRVTTDADTGKVIDEFVSTPTEARGYQSFSDTIFIARGRAAETFRFPDPLTERGEKTRSDLDAGKLAVVSRDPAAGTVTLRRVEKGDIENYSERIVVDATTFVPLDTQSSGRAPDHDSDDPSLRFPGRDFRQRMWIESFELLDPQTLPADALEMGPHPGAPVRKWSINP